MLKWQYYKNVFTTNQQIPMNNISWEFVIYNYAPYT